MILVGREDRSQNRWSWRGRHLPPAPYCASAHSSYLVKLEGHANPRGHHSVKQVHVRKDPLITRGGDAEVPLEQGMQAIEEGLQAGWGEDISNGERARGAIPCLAKEANLFLTEQCKSRQGQSGVLRVSSK